MKRLRAHMIGVDRGSRTLFSDVEHDGPMWTGEGPREVRVAIVFSEPFRDVPVVHLGMSMWDAGFEVVFRTWDNSRVARVRADWIAIGEVSGDDDWEVV